MPGWFPWVLLLILIIVIIVLLAVAIILVYRGSDLSQHNNSPQSNQPDPLPVRLGVLLLGAVVVLCVGGLILVGSSPPQVVKDTTVEPSQPTAQAAGGKTTAESTTSSAVANTANLGLSGQIVGVFGTIAAAAVGGIAGLLAQARQQ